jgi:hypothetical protein
VELIKVKTLSSNPSMQNQKTKTLGLYYIHYVVHGGRDYKTVHKRSHLSVQNTHSHIHFV